MYIECVRCPKLGKTCDGPNFVAMSPLELIDWCKERKKHLGLTNAALAEMSNMPQGTIDSLLSKSHPDFKYGTIRPLLQALVGGEWQGDPCPDPTNSQQAELLERIRHLEAEVAHRDDKIAILTQENAAMQTLIANTNKRHTDSQNFLREQLRGRNKAVVILSILLGISLLAIISALIVDRINPDIGFFWLDTVSNWLHSGHDLYLNGRA